MLYNKLALAIDQASAHANAVEKQSETLARQAEMIATLQEANQKLVEAIAQLKAQNEKPSIEIIRQDAEPPVDNFL